MKILTKWLRAYLPGLLVDDAKLAEDLTLRGIAVEGIFDLGPGNGSLYEMDLTTNRVDAMNHYGVAREASAIYDVELKKVSPMLPERKTRQSNLAAWRAPIGMTSFMEDELNADDSTTAEAFPIVIEDAQGCARYTA